MGSVRFASLDGCWLKHNCLYMYLGFSFVVVLFAVCGALGPKVINSEFTRWEAADYQDGVNSWYSTGMVEALNSANQMVHTRMQIPCSCFQNASAVQELTYKVWLCGGDGSWRHREGWREAKCDGEWVSMAVEHSRTVQCPPPPPEASGNCTADMLNNNGDMGGTLDLFLYFKWVAGHDKYEWMVRIFGPYVGTLSTPALQVRYHSDFVNEDFTNYELVWTYVLLGVTILVIVSFFSNLKHWHWCPEWELEQKAVVGLLIGLPFFNNPLFLLVVQSSSSEGVKETFQMMFLASSSLFVCFLLFLVLCMLDEMRLKLSGRPAWQWFYIPKAVLTLAIWVTMVAGYISILASEGGKLQFDGMGDVDKHRVVLGLLLVELIIYTCWVTYAALRSLAVLEHVASPFVFLYIISIFTIMMASALLASFYFGASALQFALLFGVCNLFVWCVGVGFASIEQSVGPRKGSRYFTDGPEEEGLTGVVAAPATQVQQQREQDQVDL